MEEYSPSENPKNVNVSSIFAFMFSVLIYVSVFYFIPPMILLHTTKFWFFLSNNLVLIIAIDYSTFSASKHDLYHEIVAQSRTRSVSIPTFAKQDQEYFTKARSSKTKVVQEKEELNRESGETLELETDKMIEDGARIDIQVVDLGRIEVDEREDNSRNSEIENEEEETSVENEFSTLTDEELHRRVEEFIRRFNDEIRLQALRNLHQN